jgi:long-chain acyl-CoA synthetase
LSKKSPYDSKIWLKNYDKHVPPEVPEPRISMTQILDDSARDFPEKTAVVFYKSKITFRELKDYADRVATGFRAMGISEGDVVGLHMPNLPHYLITLWGAWKAGAIAMGVSPLMKEYDLKHQIRDSGAKAIVTTDMYVKLVNSIKPETSLQHVFYAGFGDFPGGPLPKVKDLPGVVHFLKLIKEYEPKPPKITIDIKKTPAFLQYTGGTTGLPKGAILTHHNALSNVIQYSAWLGLKKGVESAVSGFPFFHIAGTLVLSLAMYNAAQQALVVNPRDIPLMFQLINEHRPTLLANVATLYVLMLRHPDFKKCDFSSVKFAVSGATGFPASILVEFQKATKVTVIEVYGLTEASPLISSIPVYGKKKPGSVGMPLPSTDIRIVELGTKDKEVPLGEPGDLITRGPQVFKGYWNKPEETRIAMLGDGWFRTGDVVKMDEDGYLYMVDRSKDMISVGGMKVYPREVDDLLVEHKAILMAATVGYPDTERPGSERVKAFVVLKQGYQESEELKQDIIKFVKDKIAPYKVPKLIEFRKELPLTLVGKVVKRSLREEGVAK